MLKRRPTRIELSTEDITEYEHIHAQQQAQAQAQQKQTTTTTTAAAAAPNKAFFTSDTRTTTQRIGLKK